MTEFNASFVGKVLVFTLAYTVLGAVFPTQQSLTTVTYLLGVAVAGFLYALLFGFVLTQMPVKRVGRILSIWGAVYVVQYFNPLIEGYIFTDIFEDSTLFVGGALFGAMLAFAYALIAGFLFAPKQASSSLSDGLRGYFRERKMVSWIWRAVASALSWPLFYVVFGAVVGPIVTPYYTDPNSGFNLVLPSLDIIIGVQALRGFIYVGALLPLVAFLKIGMKRLLLPTFGFLYIGGSVAIFMIVETFPIVLRIAHGFGDLLGASLMFSLVLAYLFARKS